MEEIEKEALKGVQGAVEDENCFVLFCFVVLISSDFIDDNCMFSLNWRKFS